jgi:hypothetical protein
VTVRSLVLIPLAAAVLLGGCGYGTYEYPPAQYVNRSQTITMSAGNAQEINEATQVIDPWRREARKRRIPANGERMVNAAERYRAKTSAGSGPGQSGAAPVGGTPTTPGSLGTTPTNPTTPNP